MSEPVYVKDLFEEDFIEKFLTFLYSEKLAIKKYKIDIEKIKKDAKKKFYRLHGEYLSEYIPIGKNAQECEAIEKKYFEDLEKEKYIFDKYHFAYSGEEKYTFEISLPADRDNKWFCVTL